LALTEGSRLTRKFTCPTCTRLFRKSS
jgi:transcription elongation factor Elf1